MAKKKVVYWFGADITEFEKKLRQIENQTQRMAASTKRLGAMMSKNITAPLTGLGALAIRESISFESAFANVKKTVIGTEEQLKKLEKGILKLSTEMPTTAKDIAEVAASAGQLGIETENILTFTKAMIQLGETSNMSANEAADALARFANITRMNQRDFDRLGSTVVALGNSLATTEKEVVEMSLRLAGAAKQIGMTEPEILAFAGSLSSVGIEAQAGGSAFSKLMINMKLATVTGGQELKNFAAVAGVTASEFKTLFAKDASGAILKFIQGLASLEGTGVSAIEVLDKMGITGIRLRDAILRATGASDIFSRSLALGRTEWEQNNAMQKKTAAFYQTTEAQLKILRNQVMLTAKEIGDTLTPSLVVAAEKARELVKAFSDLSPEMKTNIIEWGLVAAAIGPLLIILGKAIAGFKELLLNARKFTTFLSAHPGIAVIGVVASSLYVAMDTSTEGQETLSERRGLGLNKSGRSAGIQARRDFKTLPTSSSSETKSLAAIQRLDALNSRPGQLPDAENREPEVNVNDIDKASRAGKSAATTLVENIRAQIQYLYAEGKQFLPFLDSWAAKLKPLSDDWMRIKDLIIDINAEASKRVGMETALAIQSNKVALAYADQLMASKQVQTAYEAQEDAAAGIAKYWESEAWGHSAGLTSDADYLAALNKEFRSLSDELSGEGLDMSRWENWSERMREIFDKIQSVAGTTASNAIETLRRQMETGTLSNAQYLEGLEALKSKLAEYPAVVKLVNDEITTFNDNLRATTSISSQLRAATEELRMKMVDLPTAIADTFASAIRNSESLSDAFKNLLKDIGALIVKAMVLQAISPLFGGSGGGVGGLFGSLFGITNANGNVFNQSGLVPFANGGVIDRPTIFPFARGVGLMGEKGPEAIMPLERGSDGKLGVKSSGEGGDTHITMNINAVDSQSFIQALRNNKIAIESIVVENLMRNGAVRTAMRGAI